MTNGNWKEKLSGVAMLAVTVYILTARFPKISSTYFGLFFIVGSVLILLFGDLHLWGTNKPADNPKKGQINNLYLKARFRLLKVIFIFLFLVVTVIVNSIIIDGGIKKLDLNKTLVHCTQEKQEVFSLSQAGVDVSAYQLNDPFNYHNFKQNYPATAININNHCGIVDYELLANKFNGRPAAEERIEFFQINPVYSYHEAIQYFILGNLAIIACAAVIRSIFYYIVLGS